MAGLAAACLLICALPLSGAWPQDAITSGEILDLERCIALALENHPALLAASGSLRASRGRVQGAKSGYYPQVSASSAYTRSHPADTEERKGTRGSLYRNSVDLSQNIYDFGRTSALVEVQSLGASASREDLRDTSREVVFNVKQAYYGILQARQDRDTYAEAVKLFQLHLEQAKKFYEVGLRAKIDVTTAEVNLGQARLSLLNAENSLRIARIVLNNAMGMPDAPPYEVENVPVHQEHPADLDSALEKAYDRRPDLLSARARVDAARQEVVLAGKGYYPRLSGNAGYGWSGSDYPLGEGWSFGASLDFPLFNGFLTRSQVEEARGNLQTAQAVEKLVRQNVRFDVEQAFYNLKSVREKMSLAELTLAQARQNRDLALGRYQSKVGSSIEVADAVLAEISARTAYVNTLYDYRTAVASLEMAMGGDR
ncbi:MAG TPA: TolC family protein [Deltaproteobacteria bacterium]|nr:TolC family protein [Deltaproteobacteria bacterium]